MDPNNIIRLTLDLSRDDKGKTANYHVYAASEQMTVPNGKGQSVTKNAIMGGNGTLYVGNPIANGIADWVLVPGPVWATVAHVMDVKKAVASGTPLADAVAKKTATKKTKK